MEARVSTPSNEAPWTTRRLLKWMHEHFESRGIDAPRVCAEMLLARAFQCERLQLYMEPERPANDSERTMLRAFVQRIAAHEPVQFVVGEAWFHSRAFRVSPATLIPRPSTERVVEEAISFLRARGRAGGSPDARPSHQRMLDLCTGTGCIAISVALAKGVDVAVLASDISPEALELAAQNATRLGAASRVRFAPGDLYGAIAQPPDDGDASARSAEGARDRFDLITANPPYVSDAEWDALEPNVRLHEPALALRGGPDGMDLVRRVVDRAPHYLARGGLLLVEIGHAQRDAALALAHATAGLSDASVLEDHEGFHRVLRATASAD